MDTAEDHERAALFYEAPERIPSQSVPRMNAYANDIAGCNRQYIQWLQRLVTEDRIAKLLGRSCGQNEQPTGRDDGRTESRIAWVDQMYSQNGLTFS